MNVQAVEACRMLIEAYDRGSARESVAWEELDDAYHAALPAVESGHQATMVVEVRGGLVQEIYASAGVRPIVIDWDTEGADESELTGGAAACQWDRVASLDDLPPDTRAVVDGCARNAPMRRLRPVRVVAAEYTADLRRFVGVARRTTTRCPRRTSPPAATS